MNLQGVFNVYLLPYHISLLYIDPLIGGVLALGFLESLQNTKFHQYGAIAIALLFCEVNVLDAYNRTLKNGDRDVQIETFAAIKKLTPPDSTIAVFPYRAMALKSRCGISFNFQLSTRGSRQYRNGTFY